eukprot:m.11350 g.11350  ORF g.11350 m.11350 type:complete len:166 (+) comp5701_c0_seq1:899-1396(+)
MARMHISEIHHNNLHFLITDRPSADNVDRYLEELKKNNVTKLVRVCDPSYDTSTIKAAGIEVFDWPCDDGKPPPENVIAQWLELCEATFNGSKDTIAVHCVAGLGRAPVLVTIALIEGGMKAGEAIMFVRKHRVGAINKTQLTFLQDYRPGKRKKGKGNGGCAIM